MLAPCAALPLESATLQGSTAGKCHRQGILSMLWLYCRVVRLLKIVGADTFATWAAPRLEVSYAQISGEKLQ
jgi:hypothetical protein